MISRPPEHETPSHGLRRTGVTGETYSVTHNSYSIRIVTRTVFVV